MEQLQTEYGIFTSNEETGQTAQQVYDGWLANKDNQVILPTTEERLQMAEETLIYLLMGGM